MKPRALLAAGAVAVTALGAWLWLGARVNGPGPEAPAMNSPRDEAPAPDLSVGRARTFDVEWTQSIRMAKAGAKDGDSLVTRLAGQLEAEGLASPAPGRRQWRGVLSHVELSANGTPMTESLALTALSRPFMVETDSAGRVLSVGFEAELAPTVRGFVKSVVAEMQVVQMPGDRWSAFEEDTTGEYEATYEREAGHPDRLRKVKARYLKIAGPDGLKPVGETGDVKLRHEAKIQLSPEGPVEIESHAATELAFGEGMPAVSAGTTFRMKLRGETAAEARAPLKALQSEPLAAPPPPVDAAASRREADQSAVGDVSLEQLEKELLALADASPRERAEVMQKMQSAFRLRPEDTRTAVDYVRGASVADGKSVTAALGGASTPEALRALADIGGDARTPLAVRTNALTALAINPVPSPETVQALGRMISDGEPQVSGTAVLALGGAARNVRTSDPATYDGAIRTLVNGETASSDLQQRALYLRALGNSGDPAVLPLAEQAMQSPEPELRLAAVTSVRFVADARADALLTRALQADLDPSVRSLAAETIEGFRAVAAYLPVFATVLQADAVPHVRYMSLHAVGTVKGLPAALELIKASAQNDPSEDVRQFAQALLNAAGAQQPAP